MVERECSSLFLFLEGNEFHHGGSALITSSKPSYLSKTLPPDIIIWGVRVSTYELWGDPHIQCITVGFMLCSVRKAPEDISLGSVIIKIKSKITFSLILKAVYYSSHLLFMPAKLPLFWYQTLFFFFSLLLGTTLQYGAETTLLSSMHGPVTHAWPSGCQGSGKEMCPSCFFKSWLRTFPGVTFPLRLLSY